MQSQFIFILILILARCRDISEAEYDTLLETQQFMLVLFYAPWCKHCQILKPEFDKAAITLQNQATLAKVDCTQYPMLCDRLKVNSYPTLKFYLRGEEFEYSGGRSQVEIENWVRNVIVPRMHQISTDDALQEILMNHALVLVCHLQCNQVNQNTINRFQKEVLFIDASLIPKQYKVQQFSLHAAHFKQPIHYNSTELSEFLEAYKDPSVKEFSQVEEKMIVLFYSRNEIDEQFSTIYQNFQIAAQINPDLSFFKADVDTDLARMMQVLSTPQIQYITYTDKQFQHCALSNNLDNLEYIAAFIDNPPLRPYRRAIPKMLTNSTFNSMDRDKNTLVLFFSYRSKKGQKLLQLITELYQEEFMSPLVYAKVDVDEHPNLIEEKRFPQIFLYPAHKEKVAYDMESKIDKEELREWIKKTVDLY